VEYAEGIMRSFQRGLLDCPDGTTLRLLLSEMLCCDGMRVTKKFRKGRKEGSTSLGMQRYVQRTLPPPPLLLLLLPRLPLGPRYYYYYYYFCFYRPPQLRSRRRAITTPTLPLLLLHYSN